MVPLGTLAVRPVNVNSVNEALSTNMVIVVVSIGLL